MDFFPCLIILSSFSSSVFAAVIAVGVAILLMCVRILMKKGGTFHSEDVGQSKAMRERGIGCARSQDRQAQLGNPRRINTKEL